MELLNKLTLPILSNALRRVFSVELEVDKTFADMGLGELDSVELLLEIEKDLNISIDDNEWQEFESRPISYWRAQFRQHQIDEIIQD